MIVYFRRYLFFVYFLLIDTVAFAQVHESFESSPSWADEFNYKGMPDERKWDISTDKNFRSDAQYVANYRNCYVKNGCLNLTVRKVRWKQHKYEAARILTKKNVGFKYGKLEIRAKGDAIPGVWYALWLRPVKKNKVKYKGEINLMEYFGQWQKQKLQINFHLWGEFSNKKNNHRQFPRFLPIDVSQWHIYSMEWYRNRIKCFIDGILAYEVKNEDLVVWPFDVEYQLLLANTYKLKNKGEDKDLPETLQVDYVRYYKLKQ